MASNNAKIEMYNKEITIFDAIVNGRGNSYWSLYWEIIGNEELKPNVNKSAKFAIAKYSEVYPNIFDIYYSDNIDNKYPNTNLIIAKFFILRNNNFIKSMCSIFPDYGDNDIFDMKYRKSISLFTMALLSNDFECADWLLSKNHNYLNYDEKLLKWLESDERYNDNDDFTNRLIQQNLILRYSDIKKNIKSYLQNIV
jgi:hypothetical protein